MVKEPKFLSEIHKIRAELSQLPPDEYKKQLESAKNKYAKKLGKLYTD